MESSSNNNLNSLPSQKILRKMNYFADQDGIIDRYLSEDGRWEPHLRNTKNFIKECLKEHLTKRVSILGSGWLLDLPVNFLKDNFEEVIFYDLRHPLEIKHKFRKQSNFRFVEMDLTGGIIEEVFTILNSGRKFTIDEIEQQILITSAELPFQSDYTVSLNILNQLDILIIDYIRKKTNLPDHLANRLRANIQQKHLEFLHPGKSCLVTDFEEINLDSDNNIVQTNPLIFVPISDNLIQKKWVWEFDSKMNYHKLYKTVFNVMALKF
jgi:hypothetical protein